MKHWFASPRAAIGFLLHAAEIDTAPLGSPPLADHAGPRRDRRRADRGAAPRRRRKGGDADPPRARPETIARIIAGWPQALRRAAAPRRSASRRKSPSTRSSACISRTSSTTRSRHSRNSMLLGAIADDFTGASDLANTLAKGGMATTQFVGVPQDGAPADCEAGVVALKTRSMPAAEAVSAIAGSGRLADGAGLRAVPVQILLDLRFDAGGQYRAGGGSPARPARAPTSPSSARSSRRPGGGSSWATSSSARDCCRNRAWRSIR